MTYRLIKLVLPGMRRNGFGRIINISSMGGKIYAPFDGCYYTTKHALEGLTDSLRLETRGFGIDPVVIEPDGIQTAWGMIAAENLRKTSSKGGYSEAAGTTADGMEALYASGRLSSPDVIADVILKAVTARRPKTRYAAGYGPKLSIFIRKPFGDQVFDRVITSMSG